MALQGNRLDEPHPGFQTVAPGSQPHKGMDQVACPPLCPRDKSRSVRYSVGVSIDDCLIE